VAKEYRDAVIEFTDVASGQMSDAPLSFRRWRNSVGPTADALACGSVDDLSAVLREPLALAANKKRRVLYEWLWDGSFVYVLQADDAPQKSTGVSPRVLSASPRAAFQSSSLQAFRVAHEHDAQRSGKLRSHFLYAAHGFKQPPFYILDQVEEIHQVLNGVVSPAVRADLELLTKIPLVIRTSAAVPATLLPRSDQLKSPDQAAEWLTGAFANEVNRRGLSAPQLTLLAHHFIPATAAAFSTGAPDHRDVYIEALWGIPEGLYYYACDAYLVDTQVAAASELSSKSAARFRTRADVRFKGEFVAPDANGQFVVRHTRQPWDWKSVLPDQAVVNDVALFTRQLAAREGKRVKVMWFLGCDASTGLPPALPWYHDDEADDWSSLNRYQRNARDEVFYLKTEADLRVLEQRAGAPEGQSRLVVCLDPSEDQIIRSEEIAERVGNAASRLNAIVELSGGILSHVYYSLSRTNAEVSVRSGQRFAETPVDFVKLVRDKIPGAVVAGGESAKVSRLRPDQLAAALKLKLVEEAFEARDSTPTELVNELADVVEVVEALLRASSISKTKLREVRRQKKQKRGGFAKGLVLLQTRALQSAAPAESRLPGADFAKGVLESQQAVALETARSGPFDIRRLEQFTELVHSIDADLTHREWVVTSPERIRTNTMRGPDLVSWTIEGKRSGTKLKLRLKIRIGQSQSMLPFDTEDQ